MHLISSAEPRPVVWPAHGQYLFVALSSQFCFSWPYTLLKELPSASLEAPLQRCLFFVWSLNWQSFHSKPDINHMGFCFVVAYSINTDRTLGRRKKTHMMQFPDVIQWSQHWELINTNSMSTLQTNLAEVIFPSLSVAVELGGGMSVF